VHSPYLALLLSVTKSCMRLYRPHKVFAGASCPDGASFLPKIAGSEWKAKNGIYTLESCPPGYKLNFQECILCPASSYCLGGSAAPIPCPEGLFSSPGSNTSSCCRQVVFVITSISFPVFVQEFSSSEHEKLKQGLAFASSIPPGDIQEVGVSETGFENTLVIYKLATQDAISAVHLRLKLSQILSKTSSMAFQGLPNAYLQSVTVSACPPGFKLNAEFSITNLGNDGLCELCPAGYFCIGGSLAPTPCPTTSFSLPGSNSSSSCSFAVFVIVVTTMKMPQRNFTSSVQQKFVYALSLASKSAVDRVSVLSVSSTGKTRRIESGQTRVESQLAATDPNSALDIGNHLDASTLNLELAAQGLPAASLESITVLASSQNANAQQWVIALVIVSVVIVFLLVMLVYLRIFYLKPILTDDSDLMLKITEIRQRLSLMPKDGYYLPSEKQSFWSKRRDVTFLRLNHFEAAGRLALFCDYDLMHFDAFCFPLYVELQDGNKKRYQALCEWILELSERLINPGAVLPDKHPSHMTVDGRFRFFVQKLCKARIWIDDDNLFPSLKEKAQLFMDLIANQCDLRYLELCNEPRGQELVMFQRIIQQDAKRWSSWSSGKGNSLLKTFSSGPFFMGSPSAPIAPSAPCAPAETCSAVCGSADFVFDKTQQVPSSLYVSKSSETVSRQDHMEVRSGGTGWRFSLLYYHTTNYPRC
jgi:hypothetical protein